MPALELPVGMVQEEAPVLANRRIAADHYRMRLKSPRAAQRARPGQFVHVLCRGRDEQGRLPLLRRPLSLFDTDPRKGTIDFIYKVVGSGTEVLSGVRSGSRVDFIGPLGNAFEIPGRAEKICLVGGGVGIPPLYFLAKQFPRDAVQVFLGARTKEWVICAADFRKLGLKVHVATDDGTLGHKGSVVNLLSSVRGELVEAGTILYICGPTPMMAAAASFAQKAGLPAHASLEERMGCAMGCCMGCVVEVKSEPAGSHARYQRVCTEGPVFDAQEVLWN